MNYRTIIVIFTMFMNVIQLNGQAKINQFYLLMASSDDHISHWHSEDLNLETADTTRPSILYLLERGELKSIDTINFNQRIGSIMPECRHFEGFKFFYIREKGLKGKSISDNSGTYYFSFNEGNYVSVLDYSGDTIILRKANADSISLGCELINGHSFINMSKNLVNSFSMCDDQIIYEKNIINKYLKVDKIPEKVFYDGLYSISESSLFGRTLGGFPFNKKGELVLSFDGNIDIELWKKVYFQFPYKINSKKYANVNYLLKTPSCNKEVLYKRLYSGATDSITAYYIYDKNTKHLDSMNTHFKILGMNLYKDSIGFGMLLNNASYKLNAMSEMPSVSRYSNKYGIIPNLQYFTGKFFIWNLDRNDFKVYEMGDLDTELLSIHEDWVYFRIFDEIRKIKLSDLDSRDYKQKTELLLKDRIRVPNIHHVFWAPEMPLKVEWVGVKPKKK